jgi:hypothetical protein
MEAVRGRGYGVCGLRCVWAVERGICGAAGLVEDMRAACEGLMRTAQR